MDQLIDLTASKIPTDTASRTTLRAAREHNVDSFWGIFTRGEDQRHNLAGYYGFLLLNEMGHRALLDRTFDTKCPRLELVAGTGERPAAIYLWGVIAEKLTRVAGPEIARQMAYLHSGLPLYATLATDAGYKAAKKSGYLPVTNDDDRLGGLFISRQYVSEQTSEAPAIKPLTNVVAVSRADQLIQAISIRAAVFMTEQRCPFEEEFDENDYCATHLLGFVDCEPAATMRLRYFGDFVKFERMAVLAHFRQTAIKHEIVHFAFEMTRKKGFRQCYGHAQRRLLDFWRGFGFEVFPRDAEIRFSDCEYVEIWKQFAPHDDPMTMHSDPMVLNRPEGRWSVPGALDRSTLRRATGFSHSVADNRA